MLSLSGAVHRTLVSLLWPRLAREAVTNSNVIPVLKEFTFLLGEDKL